MLEDALANAISRRRRYSPPPVQRLANLATINSDAIDALCFRRRRVLRPILETRGYWAVSPVAPRHRTLERQPRTDDAGEHVLTSP